jgi:hypothetical protein
MNTNNLQLRQEVEITDNYTYTRGFIGLAGIIVKEAGEGFNVFVSGINGGGNYFDQIFWFPANCLAPKS